MYIYIYKTTKILEIRLADISSLLVKDFVRATHVALTKSFTNKDEISASLISSIFVVLYAFFWRKDLDK